MKKQIGLILLAAMTLFGQADRGSIAGTVTDASGSAVPNVRVQVKNLSTNLLYSSVTAENGEYSFLNLPVGAYQLAATAQGFQRHEVKSVDVQVNQQSRIDISLRVGDISQTVEVTAVAPMIQSESTDVGTVISDKRFLDLPLTLGGGIRNPSSFIFLSPGVTPGGTWEKHIAGGGSFSDEVYYDGIALSRGDLLNDSEVNPSVDAIQEFKLITNNYSAEYTHALAGVTSYTMKSGTNQLHGDAFEFNDNDHFDARGFFNPAKAHRNQNEFGFTVGGPVWIPKVYNGRDKTFWFVSLDQFFIRGGQLTGLNTIPTAKMLNGDFSEWPAPIYDPRSTSVDPSGKVSRNAFAGNVIPQSLWSSVSSNMLAFHPKPDFPGLVNNSVAPLSSPWANQRHHGFKIDHLISANHHLSGMYNSTDRPSLKSQGPSRLVSVGNSSALENYNFQDVTTIVARINEDWTITPTLLNHAGIGYSRFHNPIFSVAYQGGWTQPDGGKLGLTGLQFDSFPTVLFNQGYTRYGNDQASENFFNTETYLDNLTWVRGHHTVKMGAEFQAHEDNYRNFNNGGGTFNFSNLETSLPGVANSGNSWASFLLGAVDNGNAYFRASLPGGRYKYFGTYIDDTWKLTSKLTLDLGLRWEFYIPTSDVLGRVSYMNPSLPNPGAGNLPGAYVFGGNGPGRNGFNRFFDTHYKNFAPRFGLAYSVTPRTVIRGGFGIFYKEWLEQGVGIPQAGFSLTPSFVSPDSLSPAFYWDSGFPQNFAHPPIISPTVANGQTAQAVFPGAGGKLPYSLQFNLTVERQITDTLMISGAYVGLYGRNLLDSSSPNNTQLNQVDPRYLSLGQALLTSNINSPAAQAAGFSEPFPGFSTLYGKAATVAQALRPFPQYQGVSVVAAPYGSSEYNSFQFKMDKRFSHSISATTAYTFSKFLADTISLTGSNGGVVRQNYYDRDRFIYPTDQTHVLSFSFNYYIPYGGSSQSGWKGKLLGGWSLDGFAVYASGYPLAISTANTLSYIFNGGLRPNLTGAPLAAAVGPGGFDPHRDHYLNPAAFVNPPAGQFGNAPVYLPVRAPMTKNESFGILKDTRFAERMNLQFRTEMSNPFNRVVFGAPSIDFSSAANFGRIGSQGNSPRQIQFGLKLIW